MQQNISEFIQRWQGVQLSCATELSSSQTFVLQLCELLGLPEIEAQFKGRGPWKTACRVSWKPWKLRAKRNLLAGAGRCWMAGL